MLLMTTIKYDFSPGIRLRVIHNETEEGSGLSAITVTLPTMADTELTAFLKKFHLLKGLTEE